MSIKYKPQFVLTTYRSDVPEDAFPVSADEPLDNVTLEPYVPDKKPQQLLPIHTRTNRFAVTTAEPLKPAVVYQDQETQTDDVVVSAVPVSCMHVAYQPYKRPEAAELLSENIRLQREVDALELRQQENDRAVEELRLAVETLSTELRRQEQDRAAGVHLDRVNDLVEIHLDQLERDNESRQKLQHKAKEQRWKPAQPPARTRTSNRVPVPKK